METRNSVMKKKQNGRGSQGVAGRTMLRFLGQGLECEQDPSGRLRPIFSWTLLCLALFCLCFVEGCRLDMHTEPRYDPLSPSTLFSDGRSERPMVPGQLHGVTCEPMNFFIPVASTASLPMCFRSPSPRRTLSAAGNAMTSIALPAMTMPERAMA